MRHINPIPISRIKYKFSEGDLLRIVRMCRGETMERFSVQLGISRPTLDGYESGRYPIPEKLYKMIAREIKIIAETLDIILQKV